MSITVLGSSFHLVKVICKLFMVIKQQGGMRHGPSAIWFCSSVKNPTGNDVTPSQLSILRFLSKLRFKTPIPHLMVAERAQGP
jgi:hypothetical protein